MQSVAAGAEARQTILIGSIGSRCDRGALSIAIGGIAVDGDEAGEGDENDDDRKHGASRALASDNVVSGGFFGRGDE